MNRRIIEFAFYFQLVATGVFLLYYCLCKIFFSARENNDASGQLREDVEDGIGRNGKSEKIVDAIKIRECLQHFKLVVRPEDLCKNIDMYSHSTEEYNDMIKIPREVNNNTQSDLCSIMQIPARCIICLDSYKVGDSVVWSNDISCSHVYHEECIFHWLCYNTGDDNKRCPTCRQTFIHMNKQNNPSEKLSGNYIIDI